MTLIARAVAGLLLAGTSVSAAFAADLSVTIEGVRSARGFVSVCVFADGGDFPDCSSAPPALQKTVPVADLGKPIVFAGLRPGTFAIAALHDENANGRLDTNFLGIPREGIAISNNRLPKFSAPRFRDAAFEIAGPSSKAVRMVYR